MKVYKNENVINVEFGTSNDINIEKMLYQWNKGQILHFLDIPKNAEIQFSNKNTENTINKLLDKGKVEIPDVLLEVTDELFCTVQYVDENSITTIKKITMSITENTKPSDYIEPDDEPTFREEMQGIMNETKKISESAEEKASSVVERANNGEFNGKNGIDGKDGLNGKDGKNGIDGYTPQKGIDYFDGEKGEKGDKGEQGIQGIQGEKGEDGKDYVLTETDKEEIAKLTIDDTAVYDEDKTWSSKKLTDKFSSTISTDAMTGILNTINNNLDKKVDKVDGKDLIATSEIERLKTVTNYDDTEIKAEIQNINKDWKLIQEIEVTEDLNVIEVTTDSDGNTFECDDIFIEFSNILGTNGGNLGVQLYPSSLRPSGAISTLLANPISATTKRNFFVKFTKLKGANKYWTEAYGKNTTAYSNTYAHCQSNVSVVITDDYKVRQIRIYFSSTNVITTGTIKVYGR